MHNAHCGITEEGSNRLFKGVSQVLLFKVGVSHNIPVKVQWHSRGGANTGGQTVVGKENKGVIIGPNKSQFYTY